MSWYTSLTVNLSVFQHLFNLENIYPFFGSRFLGIQLNSPIHILYTLHGTYHIFGISAIFHARNAITRWVAGWRGAGYSIAPPIGWSLPEKRETSHLPRPGPELDDLRVLQVSRYPMPIPKRSVSRRTIAQSCWLDPATEWFTAPHEWFTASFGSFGNRMIHCTEPVQRQLLRRPIARGQGGLGRGEIASP
jgi:hypothetical protein